MNKVIAIQGFEGSFHELAAKKYFGEAIDIVSCESFQSLFLEMEKGTIDYAVMAIENSVAGSILPNYARLRDSNWKIIGEIFLRIEMSLMALKGQQLETILEVHSHPIALLQCSKFFRNHSHIKLVEFSDTALSAKIIAENQIKQRGALAGAHVAQLYNLDILAEGIESNKRNFTRFLVLSKESLSSDVSITKASWSFRVNHHPGSLAKVLILLGEYKINLTKIQSLPVLGEEWNYFFYADLEFDNFESYNKVKEEINPYLFNLEVLGEYKQGEKLL
jgi:prephenate dehydratase